MNVRCRSNLWRPLTLCGLILLTGCSVLPAPSPTVARHDFGPAPEFQAALPTSVRLVGVSAPGWIDTTAIHYRMLAKDPTRLRSYADNRWAASPRQLIASRLQRAGLGFYQTPSVRYGLTVDVTDCEQVIAGPQLAHVDLRLVARVTRLEDGAVVARRVFADHDPAAATVDGAVTGLSQAVDRQVRNLLTWLPKAIDQAKSGTGS